MHRPRAPAGVSSVQPSGRAGLPRRHRPARVSPGRGRPDASTSAGPGPGGSAPRGRCRAVPRAAAAAPRAVVIPSKAGPSLLLPSLPSLPGPARRGYKPSCSALRRPQPSSPPACRPDGTRGGAPRPRPPAPTSPARAAAGERGAHGGAGRLSPPLPRLAAAPGLVHRVRRGSAEEHPSPAR